MQTDVHVMTYSNTFCGIARDVLLEDEFAVKTATVMVVAIRTRLRTPSTTDMSLHGKGEKYPSPVISSAAVVLNFVKRVCCVGSPLVNGTWFELNLFLRLLFVVCFCFWFCVAQIMDSSFILIKKKIWREEEIPKIWAKNAIRGNLRRQDLAGGSARTESENAEPCRKSAC